MTEQFKPDSIDSFRFIGHRFSEQDLTLKLRYALDDRYSFEERVVFSGGVVPKGKPREALEYCFSLLHAVAGISYYKAAVPKTLQFESESPDQHTAEFLQQIYVSGLGEFAYCNNLDLRNLIEFPVGSNTEGANQPPVQGYVVPLGGGKDSLVTVERMRRSGLPFRTISVGQSALIDRVVERIGMPHIRIQRYLDPELFRLNQVGAYNGHVPISAILASVMLCGAYLYDYDTVIMSNESSASDPNVRLKDGFEVNHQFSKSLAFERAFSGLTSNRYAPGFRYFSLLRPWSEIAIARDFAADEQYDDVFSSCNRNFAISKTAERQWCGDCPKCRFVFLAMAPFVARERLEAIFGSNLLDQHDQVPGFEVLLGLQGIKPFECVGEIGECRAALLALVDLPEWQDVELVRNLAARIKTDDDLDQWLQPSSDHCIPEELIETAHASC